MSLMFAGRVWRTGAPSAGVLSTGAGSLMESTHRIIIGMPMRYTRNGAFQLIDARDPPVYSRISTPMPMAAVW